MKKNMFVGCAPLPTERPSLPIRDGVDPICYQPGHLEHPAVAGLLLSLDERIFNGQLEFVCSDGTIRLETLDEKRFRIKWKKPVPRPSSVVAIVASTIAIGLFCPPYSARAGSVGGTGGSTEVTQIANNVQLANQYAQQVEAYVRQGLQLEAEMRNLIQNPASLLGKDIGGIINGVGRLYNSGNAIGGNLATINNRFATTFKSPTAKTLANSFTNWHQTNTDTLEAAMKAAGMHFDSQQSEADNLQRLFDNTKSSKGNLDVLMTANEINAMNVQQLQKLGNLIAAQNLAASAYMASQTAKDERTNLDLEAFQKAMLEKQKNGIVTDVQNIPKTEYKKWNIYNK